MNKLNRTFTEDEARDLYVTLNTLVYAFKHITREGLSVQKVSEISPALAVYFSTLDRTFWHADKLLNSINGNDPAEPAIVQEIEDMLLKNMGKDVCPECGTTHAKKQNFCSYCGHKLSY